MVKEKLYFYYRLYKVRNILYNLILFLRTNIKKDRINSYGTVGKTIIINSVQISAPKQIRMESTFSKYLVQRGNSVIILYCDGLLSHCDRIGYPEKEEYIKCSICKFQSKLIHHYSRSVKLVKYSSLIEKSQILKIKEKSKELSESFLKGDIDKIEYEKIDLTNDVKGSIVRYIHDGTLFYNNRTKEFMASSIANAIMSIEVAKKANEIFKPDMCLSLHAIYSSWAPFVKYLKNKNVRVIVYGKGQTKNDAMIFFNFVERPVKDLSFGWSRNKDRKLNGKEEERLNNYLEGRFNRTIGFTNYIKDTLNTNASSIHEIPFDDYYVLFPNVPWDNSLSGSDIIFESAISWISETVQWFLNHPNYNLIIRAHPSEAKYQTSRRTLNTILNERFKNLIEAENIHYIPSEEPISSYDLVERAISILVYNGTLGLEATFLGKPVVFGGVPSYKKESGLFFPISKNNYFDLISNPNPIIKHNIEARDDLIRFLYFLFFEFEIEMPFLESDFWYSFSDKKAKELIESSNNPIFDYLCKCIENNEYDFSEWRNQLGLN